MSGYTHKNLRQVEDMAAKHGLDQLATLRDAILGNPGRHPHEPRPDSHPANVTPVDKHHVNVQRSLAFDMLAA